MNVVAIVLVAGREALISVGGESLLSRSVRTLLHSDHVRQVVVVATPADMDILRTDLGSFGSAVRVMSAGADDADTLRASLAESVRLVPDADAVLLHDPARAFAPASVIRDVVGAVEQGASAAVPVLPVTDTIKQVDAGRDVRATVDRSHLRVVQGPQVFALDVLRAACEADDGDIAGLIDRLDKLVATVPGHAHALRISSPFDLIVARAIGSER